MEIIFVGRLIDVKGVHILIKAIAKLENQNVHLSVLGKDENGEYLAKLKGIIRENQLDDKVTLCGAKPNVEDYLAKADLYIHSAIWDEGFGITVIEALSAGVPCVAFNKGALGEIITEGENGFLVNDMSTTALARAIDDYYALWENDKTNELCENALKSSKKYSITETVKQLEKLY